MVGLSHLSDEPDIFDVYAVLKHPVRKKIIDFLGEKGTGSFTDFRDALDVPVGTLYYHLDVLEGFVDQDEEKLYHLTDLGDEAYRILHSEEYSRVKEKAEKEGDAATSVLRNLLAPTDVLRVLLERPLFALALTIGILAYGSLVLAAARLEPILIFFLSRQRDLLFVVGELVLSWLGLYAVADLIATLGFKRKGEHLNLLLTSSLALLPLLVYPTILALSDAAVFGQGSLLGRGLLAVFQGWAVIFLATDVSLAKGLRIEKGGLIALAAAYVSILTVFVVTGSI